MAEVKKTRGDKRQRTRARLIDAATILVNRKGYERTSLEEVARHAGMTRGAIYNNFKDKEELFFAVSETRWKPIEPPLRPGASLKEQLHILGEAVAASAKQRRQAAVGALSFQLYALTHEEMRKRLVQGNSEIYHWAEISLTRFVKAEDMPMPPNEFVRVLHAMTEGLLVLHFLTPELITKETIIAAFESMAP